MARRFLHLILASVLAVPGPVLAYGHRGEAPGTVPPVQKLEDRDPGRRSERVPGRGQEQGEENRLERAERRGVLREAKHADRLERIQGRLRGMVEKLGNLSRRLDTHIRNFERRVRALQAAGHEIAVETELAAARARVSEAQTLITGILDRLNALPDHETPRVVAGEARGALRELREKLGEVRVAFRALRRAIRDDVRAYKPSPSPLSSAAPSPSPGSEASTPLPSLEPLPGLLP